MRTTAIALCAAVLLTRAAHAQVSLDSVRIAAKDTVALAKFYQAAFGMQEVNRIVNPGGIEVFANFHASEDAGCRRRTACPGWQHQSACWNCSAWFSSLWGTPMN